MGKFLATNPASIVCLLSLQQAPKAMVVSRHLLALRRLSNGHFIHLHRVQFRGLASLKPPPSLFSPLDTFQERHIGPDDAEASEMLRKLGYNSIDAFIADTIPSTVRLSTHAVDMPSLSESQLHERAKELAAMNKPFKSFIGMGYHNAVVPPVILRNVCLLLYQNLRFLTEI